MIVLAGIAVSCMIASAAFLGAIATHCKAIADHLEQITHNTRKDR